ncbi:hypothetical protein NDU88_002647 [Pleurodeles waltl]|uniref:Uncharacterized protein n=1 Tax=Pleurodeles waltl TaxID=8319 RepID=A0AAV7P7J7_PLEWA|nr:hypothetical protein NDU88_002647 [Pleurodeles waltl]
MLLGYAPIRIGIAELCPSLRSWRLLVRDSSVSPGPTARFNLSSRIGDAGLHRRQVARVDLSPRVPPDVRCRCLQPRAPGCVGFRRVSVVASILLPALVRAGSR